MNIVVQPFPIYSNIRIVVPHCFIPCHNVMMVQKSPQSDHLAETDQPKFEVDKGFACLGVAVDEGLEHGGVHMLEPVQLPLRDGGPCLCGEQHIIAESSSPHFQANLYSVIAWYFRQHSSYLFYLFISFVSFILHTVLDTNG